MSCARAPPSAFWKPHASAISQRLGLGIGSQLPPQFARNSAVMCREPPSLHLPALHPGAQSARDIAGWQTGTGPAFNL